jgi:hypothetical protein
MEEAPRMDESAEDITAAVTAPNPTKVMIGGVIYWRVIGRINFASLSGIGSAVLLRRPAERQSGDGGKKEGGKSYLDPASTENLNG